MTLAPGTRLGPYEITAPLGAGGMGEVYRATDRKLGREVAIKMLPEEFARHPERLARFEREAKLLASLNHPNIAAIYGLEESGAAPCLVLELVEGETLDEMISAGPLPVDRAMALALQIAEALEAAHDKGIIHRDLKPANVKVTPDGAVKVLDFGLAKAFSDDPGPAAADASLSPTLTVAATQAGIILGTAAYMSPEQAAGQPADRRSDVWAFGVVLLEMLTGRRTFGGETVSHVLASVLKDEPEWDRLPAELPPRLRELLRSCLRKKPRRRLQAIGDARVVLEEYRADPASFAPAAAPAAEAAAARPAGWKQRLPWAVAALLAAGLAGALWGLVSQTPRREASARLVLPTPEGDPLFRGYGSSVVISPEGSRVAYVLEHAGGRRLILQGLDQWEGTVLVGEGIDPYHPFFSPDGQWVGFVTRTELKKVPVRGGSALTLCRVELNRGASWGHDGTIIFAPSPGSGLSRVTAAGGEPQPLTELDKEKKEISHRWPQVLPGGKAVLFTSLTEGTGFDEASLELLLLETGERRVLHRGGTYGRYIPSGHVVYLSRGTMFAFPFDLDSLAATGSAAPVVEGVVSSPDQGGAQFDVSAGGTLVYVAGDAAASGSTLVWVAANGVETALSAEPRRYGNPALSPDGTRLVVEVEAEGDQDIWVHDLTRDVAMRLTFEKGDDRTPVWSPDGGTIYFSGARDGQYGIYRQPADGSREAELVLARDEILLLWAISPDGKVLSFNEGMDVWLLPLEGGEPAPFLQGPTIEGHARFSPDGRWIAYNSDESGSFQVYVRPASGGRGKWQISTEEGAYPHWSRDGRALYYRAGGTGAVMKVAVDTAGGGFRVGRPEEVVAGSYVWTGDGTDRYDVAPDGTRFVMMRQGEGATTEHEHIRVVLGWTDELRRALAEVGAEGS